MLPAPIVPLERRRQLGKLGECQLWALLERTSLRLLCQALGAKPVALRHLRQWGDQAEEVVALVTFVAEHNFVFMMTPLAQLAQKGVNVVRDPDGALRDGPWACISSLSNTPPARPLGYCAKWGSDGGWSARGAWQCMQQAVRNVQQNGGLPTVVRSSASGNRFLSFDT